MQALIVRALLRQQNALKTTHFIVRHKSHRTSSKGIGGSGNSAKGGDKESSKLDLNNANGKTSKGLNENESKSTLSDTPPAGTWSFSEAAEGSPANSASTEKQAERAKEDAGAAPLPPPIKPFSLDFSPPELDEQANAGTAKSSTSSKATGPPLPTSSNREGADLPSLSDTVAEDASSSRTQRTGARSSKGSLSSIERKRRNALRTFFLLGAVSIGATVIYMGRPWENEDLKSRAGVDKDAGRLARTLHRFKQFTGIFTEPVWEELLPPQIPGEERPYTLVLSVDDLLVTSIWDRQHGWRTAKRPGVDYFLNYLSQWFEIVIFTTNQYYLTDQIIEKLDPLRSVVAYRLYREATRYHDGHIVKDISHLNRDLSKVITIDTNPEHYSLQPENAIILPPWKGEGNDKGLIGLIPFLESIGIYAPPDVRPILSAYRGKDIATEYAKVEAEQKKQHIEEWLRSGGGKKQPSGSSWSSRLFGSNTPSTALKPPLTFLERKRLEAQYHYMLDERHKKANEESILAYFKAMDEANMKAMGAGSLMSFIKSWGQPPPVPEAAPPPKIVYLPPLPPPPELVNAGYFGERGIPGKR